jgi:hypothetical protein
MVGLGITVAPLGHRLTVGAMYEANSTMMRQKIVTMRIVQAKRAADGKHQLPGVQRVGIAERQRRQIAAVDLDHREIRLVIDSDDRTGHETAVRSQNGLAGRRHRYLDSQPLRAADDVRIREDVSIAVDNDARS